jgi:hypothetical protein
MSAGNGRSLHAPTSRPKPAPPGLEKADHELNLGEFQDVDTLTLSEASLVINALVAKRKMDRKNINETEYVFGPRVPCRPRLGAREKGSTQLSG